MNKKPKTELYVTMFKRAAMMTQHAVAPPLTAGLKPGTLIAWWVPNFPGESFRYVIPSIPHGLFLLDWLTAHDNRFDIDTGKILKGLVPFAREVDALKDNWLSRAMATYHRFVSNVLGSSPIMSNAGGIEIAEAGKDGEMCLNDWYDDAVQEGYDELNNYCREYVKVGDRPLTLATAQECYEKWRNENWIRSPA